MQNKRISSLCRSRRARFLSADAMAPMQTAVKQMNTAIPIAAFVTFNQPESPISLLFQPRLTVESIGLNERGFKTKLSEMPAG